MRKEIFIIGAFISLVCAPAHASMGYAGVAVMAERLNELMFESLAGARYKINVERGMSWTQVLDKINTQNKTRFRKIFTGHKMMDLQEKITQEMLAQLKKERLYVTR